jgi:hypothetical protein
LELTSCERDCRLRAYRCGRPARNNAT